MSLQSAADVPLIITSPNSSSERRISPSWTIAHLKSRLEPITGVPAGSQQLSLRVASQEAVPISAVDEEQTRLTSFPLQPYAEITVSASYSLLLLSITGPVLGRYNASVLSAAATSAPLSSSSAVQGGHLKLVSSALVSDALFVPIRCSVRIHEAALPQACIASCMPRRNPRDLSSTPHRHGKSTA
jgi:hypothetical protein